MGTRIINRVRRATQMAKLMQDMANLAVSIDF